MAVKNMNTVRIFKRDKFKKPFTEFLNFYLEKAYAEGLNKRPLEELLNKVISEYSTFRTNKNQHDFVNIEILLTKWIILAYERGKKV